jgi:ribosome-binding factor A
MKKPGKFNIKREQKKSFLFRELSALVHEITIEEPKLSSLFVTRVEMSRDSGILYVYFSSHKDKADFDTGLELLKLYKPSVRKALAEALASRYVPDLVFRYDESKEKERHINALLDKIKE